MRWVLQIVKDGQRALEERGRCREHGGEEQQKAHGLEKREQELRFGGRVQAEGERGVVEARGDLREERGQRGKRGGGGLWRGQKAHPGGVGEGLPREGEERDGALELGEARQLGARQKRVSSGAEERVRAVLDRGGELEQGRRGQQRSARGACVEEQKVSGRACKR